MNVSATVNPVMRRETDTAELPVCRIANTTTEVKKILDTTKELMKIKRGHSIICSSSYIATRGRCTAESFVERQGYLTEHKEHEGREPQWLLNN